MIQDLAMKPPLTSAQDADPRCENDPGSLWPTIWHTPCVYYTLCPLFIPYPLFILCPLFVPCPLFIGCTLFTPWLLFKLCLDFLQYLLFILYRQNSHYRSIFGWGAQGPVFKWWSCGAQTHLPWALCHCAFQVPLILNKKKRKNKDNCFVQGRT